MYVFNFTVIFINKKGKSKGVGPQQQIEIIRKSLKKNLLKGLKTTFLIVK